MVEWLKRRAAERSTWLGLLTLAGICGYDIAPELKEQILTAVTAIVAVIFAVTSDTKKVEVVDDEGRSESNTATDG